MKLTKKNRDKNFEVFKEYNKKLLSFPTAQDPFLTHKREQYKKLQGQEAGSNVFNRLTQQRGLNSSRDSDRDS